MNKKEQAISDKKFYDFYHTGYCPELEDLPIDYLQSQIEKNEKEIEDLTYMNIGFQGVIDDRSEQA